MSCEQCVSVTCEQCVSVTCEQCMPMHRFLLKTEY